MYERFWGQALGIFRGWHGLSQEETLEELNRRSGRCISLAQFDGMEKDMEEIDAGLFDVWCNLFPEGKIKALKYAQFMRENAHRPDEELLDEAMREVEYQRWKRKQGN